MSGQPSHSWPSASPALQVEANLVVDTARYEDTSNLAAEEGKRTKGKLRGTLMLVEDTCCMIADDAFPGRSGSVFSDRRVAQMAVLNVDQCRSVVLVAGSEEQRCGEIL